MMVARANIFRFFACKREKLNVMDSFFLDLLFFVSEYLPSVSKAKPEL